MDNNSVAINHCASRVGTLVALLLFITLSLITPASHALEPKFKPAAPATVEYRVIIEHPNGGDAWRRRQLAPFQLCISCKCCSAGSPTPVCATMPCCFGIDCQLPNKPFGVCAFVPKTCSCTSCAV